MYISKITPVKDSNDFHGNELPADDAYRIHRLIWSFFYDDFDHKRDFIYRFENRPDAPVIIAVSTNKPTNYNGLWDIKCMDYSPALREGQVLDFVLTANPVRNKKDSQGRYQRHDVVMDAKWNYRNENNSEQPSPSKKEIIRNEGLAWLAARSERNGFIFDESDIRVKYYRQQTFEKIKNGAAIRISLLDYSGRITVSNPEKLRRILFNGIGPAKSFGCGLMLIRQVGKN